MNDSNKEVQIKNQMINRIFIKKKRMQRVMIQIYNHKAKHQSPKYNQDVDL